MVVHVSLPTSVSVEPVGQDIDVPLVSRSFNNFINHEDLIFTFW